MLLYFWFHSSFMPTRYLYLRAVTHVDSFDAVLVVRCLRSKAGDSYLPPYTSARRERCW